jgi:DNA-binding beta-propeller fold protein YncE
MNRALAAGLAAFLCSVQAAAAGVAVRNNVPQPVGAPIEFAANGVGTGELTFTWDFGDGTQSEPSSVGTTTHVYESAGHYPVIVLVEDETSSRSDSFLQAVHNPLSERPPTSSSTIVHHRTQKRVCNVNADNDTVSCLSTEDLTLLFEAPVGRHPRTLAAAADDTLWVVNEDDASLSVLDPGGAMLTTIALPHGSKPFGIAMSPAGDKAYVTLQGTGQLVELDVLGRVVLRTAPSGPWATGIAVDATASRIFVTRFISSAQTGEVVEHDAPSLDVVRTFSLAMDPGPDTEATARGVPNYVRSVVPSPDGTLLWVPSKTDNVLRGTARDGLALTFETSVRTVVSLLDPSTNQEILDQRVDLNNRTLGLSVTFSALGDYAFVALLGNNGVQILDAYDRRIVGGVFELAKAPDGLVLDDAGRLYLNAFLSRTVVVLDAAPVLASTEFSLEKVADVIVSTAEKLSPEVLLGKQIFYDAADTRMGLDGYISCAVCHLDGFEDGQVWDFTDRGEGLRNTTSLRGKRGVGQGPLHWSANFDEVQDFEHDIRGPFGGSGFLPDEIFNEGTRSTTLGDPKAGLSPELDALAAYVTSLDRVSPSPHRDPDGSLTESAWRGVEVFQKAGCGECHGGPDFTDSPSAVRHDVGTITATSGMRLDGPLDGLDTPTLRGVWESAPYLHDGSAATLEDVVGARNPEDRHGTTSTLSAEERGDLLAYLRQIDNVALDDELEPPPMPGSGGTSGAGESGGTSGAGESGGTSGAGESGGGCAFNRAPRTPYSSSALGLLLAALAMMARRRGDVPSRK